MSDEYSVVGCRGELCHRPPAAINTVIDFYLPNPDIPDSSDSDKVKKSKNISTFLNLRLTAV